MISAIIDVVGDIDDDLIELEMVPALPFGCSTQPIGQRYKSVDLDYVDALLEGRRLSFVSWNGEHTLEGWTR